jgi:hypothetical protein
MQEERPNRTRVIAIVLIFVAVFGGWYVLSRPGTRRAAEQTADVFVPAPEEIERRRGYVEDARCRAPTLRRPRARRYRACRVGPPDPPFFWRWVQSTHPTAAAGQTLQSV